MKQHAPLLAKRESSIKSLEKTPPFSRYCKLWFYFKEKLHFANISSAMCLTSRGRHTNKAHECISFLFDIPLFDKATHCFSVFMLCHKRYSGPNLLTLA